MLHPPMLVICEDFSHNPSKGKNSFDIQIIPYIAWFIDKDYYMYY